ncbi:MAG TPA: FtsQ-type POTRA domain-containing protein [Rhizomicrobium sp.]|jgi:cell division protein FtsQ
MRSVKAQAKGRRTSRSKPQRRRTVRAARPEPAFGRRRRPPSRFARLWQNLRAAMTVRHPMMWLAASLLFILMVGVLLASGFVASARDATHRAAESLAADSGFAIAAVTLSGNHRTEAREIYNALGFEPGQSVFGADLPTARLNLLKLEWVADADVRRQYPDKISVAIVEKQPFALWETADGTYVVERSGRKIALVDPRRFARLPFLIGDGAPDSAAGLIDAVGAHRAVSARIRAYARVSQRRWNLILNDDVIVELPELEWQKQLDVLERLIVDKGVLERDISEIDLRAPDNYFFVLRNGQKQQMTRGNSA